MRCSEGGIYAGQSYRAVLSVWVFSKVLDIMELTFAVVSGPMGGHCVKWPSRQTRQAEKHRSSMDSPLRSSLLGGGPEISDNCVMVPVKSTSICLR